jgi:2-polyprenyl-3-methyl-5-hydroxy-6-metoxy-1,4-benzoquinol methylase
VKTPKEAESAPATIWSFNLKQVEEQYRNWVYPKPIEDLDVAVNSENYWEIGDPFVYWPVYWPNKRVVKPNLHILSAGCGTNQAAYQAFRNPSSKVTGIDLSDSSLAHQKYLKEKHNLTNLTLHKLNILDLSDLNERYDFIHCTGVLHHMPHPVAGFKSLASCLQPEGIANIMVYSYTLRTGVYMLQRVFRELGFSQVPEDVALVRKTLETINPSHPIVKYVKVADDLPYDTGIVDTFLHPQDKAYLAGEVFDFTRDAGLEFLAWAYPSLYSLDVAIPDGNPLKDRINTLDLDAKTAASICDSLTQATGTHRWHCGHPDYIRKIRIPFDSDHFFDCSVMLHPEVVVEAASDVAAGTAARCNRGGLIFQMPALAADVLVRLVTGSPSILEAVKAMDFNSPEERTALLEELRVLYRKLWKNGHVHILLPED